GLKERGIPIHGVGLQCHFNVGNIDTAAMVQNMRRLADLGLVTALTAIDRQFTGDSPPSTAQPQTQQNNSKAAMKACLSVPACKNYFVWGVNDNQSWRRPQGNTAPLLFTGTSAITPKPAWQGVVEALQEANVLTTSAPSAPWNVYSKAGTSG